MAKDKLLATAIFCAAVFSTYKGAKTIARIRTQEKASDMTAASKETYYDEKQEALENIKDLKKQLSYMERMLKQLQ